MILVAVVAIDFAVVSALRYVPDLNTRIGVFGILPLANLLAALAAVLTTRLVRHRDVALSQVAFLCFGGMAVVLLLVIAIVAPHLLYAYLRQTTGPGWALLASIPLTPLMVAPALLAGWMTRGRRLRLVCGPEAASEQATSPA